MLRFSLIELGNRSIALAGKLGGALELLFGIREGRLCRSELRFALIDRRFERLPLDREDHLVGLDGVALLEEARAEETLHAGPQIDFFERLGTPDKFGLFGHRAQLGRLHQHRRGRASLLGMGHKAGRHREPRRKGETEAPRTSSPTPVAASRRVGKVLQSG